MDSSKEKEEEKMNSSKEKGKEISSPEELEVRPNWCFGYSCA